MPMSGTELKMSRKQRQWTQVQAAVRLGVSQPYLALLEADKRKLPRKLARRATNLYGLSPDRTSSQFWSSTASVGREARPGSGFVGLSRIRIYEIGMEEKPWRSIDDRIGAARFGVSAY